MDYDIEQFRKMMEQRNTFIQQSAITITENLLKAMIEDIDDGNLDLRNIKSWMPLLKGMCDIIAHSYFVNTEQALEIIPMRLNQVQEIEKNLEVADSEFRRGQLTERKNINDFIEKILSIIKETKEKI